ncbi:MAG: PEP/pyruvate-binding domain-containing protein [Candidatus Competibacterales bacterium]
MIPWLLVPPAVVSRTQGGGKAFHLARLAGLPIPPWLVVTPGAVVDGRLDGAVAAALTAALPRLGPGPYAVRSSAVAEDGAAGAFAGQLASYLDVPAPGVAAAVVEVVHSACGLGVWRYAQRLGLAPPAQVAVVVQAMVSARVAGVAFGVDPTRETRDALAIAAAPGTGQGLVGGAVSGDYYRLSAAGETLSLEISGPAPVLNEAERRAVLALLHKVEAQSAVPQDIEWALDQAGDLWLLQARPVTALPEAGDLAPGVVWDNANIVESYPGVTSPLTFSFIRRGYAQVYRRLFRLLGVPKGRLAALEGVFAGLLGYLHGRVYYQLLHWYRLVALLPGFATNRRALEQMMGLADALTEAQVAALAPATRRAGLWDRLVLARAAAGLGVQALLLPWTAARFTRRLAAALGPPPAPWPRLDAHQLVAHYRHLEGQLLGRWDAPLVNDLLCMITCGVARGVLKRW